ncbi:N-acetylneuraminate synthase [Pedobacter sp. JY14-1]|uniref:N-acetylneuraminate synthase n=1 Tax=Pedobacter sp. JY14-1 TaxID=3034151 RepID=UPI0023E34EBE|nr:N-acetylneuraminate synthase [Pedobacter sp. JY14-1]
MRPTTIIAEAGVNHNGSIETAFQLIDAAATAGVDYVKFQTFRAEKLVSKGARMAAYQMKNMNHAALSQFDMLKRLELSHSDHEKLINYCRKKGIKFFSTAFDLESLSYLNELGLDLVKIPSGEITNLPFLRKAARMFPKAIISTGMSTVVEIEQAVDVLLTEGISRDKISILHCNTEYPTPMSDVNLTAMLHLQKIFGTVIGYSDHTLGIEVPIAAVAIGATVIEKHFTLDRTLPGPDHAASLEPEELSAMVKAIRNIELAVSGSGIKEPSKSELKNLLVARKSIHLNKDKKAGQCLNESDLEMLRPGDGISPMRMHEIIGKTLNKDLLTGHKLSFEDLI